MDLAFLAAVAEPILRKLTSFAIEEIGLASSVKQDLDHLNKMVTRISALLHDAQKVPLSKHKSVTVWIRDMTDALYDTDNLLEEFNYESLIKGTVTIYARFKQAHMLKHINMRLDQVVKDGAELGLTPLLFLPAISESSAQQDPRQTLPIGDVSMILGRDGDKSKVLDMILQSSGDFSVVAIVGLAGLGKTTLAKLIYKDTDNTNFDERIWVCVSNDFDVNAIMKAMAAHLDLEYGEKLNNMIKKLTEKLSKKKCLFILDDVWPHELSKWDMFKDWLFEIGADKKESKILVTTRSNEVALCMHGSTHPLEGLSDDDSWSLFGKRAFSNKGPEEIARVTNIGKRIIKRCKSVPLAILTLGALLHTKHENDWHVIEKSELWDLSSDESGIMSALRLSYDHFLPHLKPCFAYCSIFPKDHIFMKDDLVQLWIAQGFIQSTGGSKKTMMDIGNECFDILVWNSFFQDVQTDKYDNVRTCKMHDLVHDLAQTITKNECLVLDERNVIGSLNENDNLDLRHLHLLEKKGTIPKISNGHKLRTLFLPCEMRQNDSLKFECLRVLNFEKAYTMKELPKSVGKLKSLRYLNVSNTRIKKFPISILELHSLQTIRFMNCRNFENLPKRLGSMISLTHLCFDNYYADKMPFEFGRLTSLQTLSIFNVGRDKGHMIQELGSLKMLRGELHIQYLERIKHQNEAESANLMTKINLFKLIFEWSRERSESVNMDEEVLAGLEPPPNLRSLTIKNFAGSNFPRWMLTANVYNVIDSNNVQLERLVEIKLINCKKCERIPTLGELPCLKFLEIIGMGNLETIGGEFYSNNVNNTKLVCGGGSSSSCVKLFPLLETLKLVELNKLVEWHEASTSVAMGEEGGIVEVFPKLKDLSIRDCSQLKTAPTHFPFLETLSYMHVKSGEALSKICRVTTTLTDLRIYRVAELIHLPEVLLQKNTNLIKIDISWCNMLESITREDDNVGLQNLVSLRHLEIRDCPKLSHIGSMRGLTSLEDISLWGCGEIRNLPIGLGSCTCLEKVHVRNCKNIGEEGLMELKSLNSLKDLSITGSNMKCVPQKIQHLTALEKLTIYGFDEVEALPDWLGNLSSLQSLEIEKCRKLSHMGSMHGLTSLIQLKIYWCDEITKLPIGLESCTSLEKVILQGCENLCVAEEDLRELKSLSKLSIINCGKGDFQFKGSSNRLKELETGAFTSELESFPFNFNMSVLQTSLTSLRLEGWPKLKSLPQQIQHLAALRILFINEFQGLEALPDWLENLSSLQSLTIWNCEKLKYLPSLKSMRRLTNLERLDIWLCPVLKERCKTKNGPEWSKISHIPDLSLT